MNGISANQIRARMRFNSPPVIGRIEDNRFLMDLRTIQDHELVWIKDAFDLSRNNYDKVGHLAQGFVPAMITRELFIRKNVVVNRKWLSFIVVSICMAISVLYEFIEWFVAELTGEAADSFLGTQGYIWDTQSDMLYATIGAIIAILTLSKIHDKLIDRISVNNNVS